MPNTSTNDGRCPRAKRAILSIDGGGVKGILAACVLEVLEQELRRESGITNLLIAECFDIITGTSTGSILASYFTQFANPKFMQQHQEAMEGSNGTLANLGLDGSAAKAIGMYRALGPAVFPQSKKRGVLANVLCGAKYTAANAEALLAEAFGPVTLHDLAIAESAGRKLASTMLTMCAASPAALRPVALRDAPHRARFPFPTRATARSQI